jgi:TRAP-type uncharacterized transport system fused permease subunit
MMIGTASQIVLSLGSAIIGVLFLSAGLAGMFLKRCLLWERILISIAGAGLFVPGLKSDLLGLLLGAAIILSQMFLHRSEAGVGFEKNSTERLSA